LRENRAEQSQQKRNNDQRFIRFNKWREPHDDFPDVHKLQNGEWKIKIRRSRANFKITSPAVSATVFLLSVNRFPFSITSRLYFCAEKFYIAYLSSEMNSPQSKLSNQPQQTAPELSLFLPVLNEEENLRPMHAKISEAL